jgi:perosamine synthetase
MVLSNDPSIADRCRKLRNLAFEPNGRRFVHHELGWNYRMTNLQAALGVAQLERLDDHVLRKRAIGRTYQQRLKDIPAIQLPLQATAYAENIYWVFGIVTETEEQCNDTVRYLNEHGVGTRPFFWCMHEQPVFNKMGLFENESYPDAERLARNGFYLPSGLGLADDDVDYVVQMLKERFA